MKYLRSKFSELAVPLIIGFSAYVYFIRFHGFWPTDVNWLLPNWNGNIDSAGDYIGWEMYRQSSLLQWPIGRSPMLGPDGGSSIAFTTLPILALIFKPLTHWSREPLQFYGLWSMVCFLGQAVSAWKLVGLWVKDRLILALAVCFFVMSPAFLDRLTFHFGPSAHWLLLSGLYFYFSPRFQLKRWLILGSLAILIFPYLFMMVTAIFIARITLELFRQKRLRQFVIGIVSYFGLLAVVAWQSGYFVLGGSEVGAGGFGTYSANALTFVDPGFPDYYRVPWSGFIPNQWENEGQYEGFGYLGSGVLLLAMLVWVLRAYKGDLRSRILLVSPPLLMCLIFGRDSMIQFVVVGLLGVLISLATENLFQKSPNYLQSKLIISLTTIGMFILALSNIQLIGQHKILSFNLSETQLRFISIARSSGRFVWPLMLLMITLIVVSTIKLTPKKLALPLLVAMLLLQGYDSRNAQRFTTMAYARSGPGDYLVSNIWNEFGKRYSRVFFAPAVNKPRLFLENNSDFVAEEGVLWRDIGVLAQKYGWSMNSYHFSRDPAEKFQSENVSLQNSLATGQFDPELLYIFHASDEWERAKQSAGTNDLVGVLNGVPVLAPNFYPCNECGSDGFIDRHALEYID
jgi:hypothetical protein